MAQIGTLRLNTGGGIVSVPIYPPADIGSGVYDIWRINTPSGVGVVPLASTTDATYPYLRVNTQNYGILAVHDAASTFTAPAANKTLAWDESFEQYGTSVFPVDWELRDNGSNGHVHTVSTPTYEGTRALNAYQPNTGSPSNWEFSHRHGVPGDYKIIVRGYINGKLNSGSAEGFHIRGANGNFSASGAINEWSYLINLVGNNGSDIVVYNGDGDEGGGVWETYGANQLDWWLSVEIEVYNSTNEYYVTVNGGTRHGPLRFHDDGPAGKYPYIWFQNDNYDWTIDDLSIETLDHNYRAIETFNTNSWSSLWEAYNPGGGASITASNHELNLNYGSGTTDRPYLRSTQDFTHPSDGGDVYVKSSGKMSGSNGQVIMLVWWDGQTSGTYSTPENALVLWADGPGNKTVIRKWEGGVQTDIVSTTAHDPSTSYTEYEFDVTGTFSNFSATAKVDGTQILSTTGQSFSPTASSGRVGLSGRETTANTQMDSVFVR